jgi:hypothetical protein
VTVLAPVSTSAGNPQGHSVFGKGLQIKLKMS